MNTNIKPKVTIEATIIRADGTKEDLGSLTQFSIPKKLVTKIKQILEK